MSFSSSSTPAFSVKKFESQNEVDEKRKKRQEEWEKVRKPDDPQGTEMKNIIITTIIMPP